MTGQTGCSSAPSSDSGSAWRIRRFTYDSLSRLVTAKNPESGAISYTYDSDGNVITKTDARGITTTMAYDQLHRVTQKSYSDGTPTFTFSYDQNNVWGNPISNPIGRMVLSTTPNVVGTELFSYDSRGGWPILCGTQRVGLFAFDLRTRKCQSKFKDPTLAAQGWATPAPFHGEGCGTQLQLPTLLYSMYYLSGIICPMRTRYGRIAQKGGPPAGES